MTEIADLSAVELSSQLRSKALSPVEVTDAILARIDARADLNAFITITADEARAEAKAAEAKLMEGSELPPLLGIPYSVKDLVNTAGVRTTMGSKLFETNVPKEDGVAVARARAAGAILVGKNTTPEFGHVQSATSPLFGRTLNPIDPTVTPGASSSGAAVAVAAGMGPIALGTDGGGSIRIPAACCGVVGFKATLGVVPHLQLPDLFGANSYVGPMARNVADAALLFEAIAGPDPRDPYGQAARQLHETGNVSLKRLRVAYIANGGARVEREVAAITKRSVEKLAGEGALVEEAEMDFKSYEPVFLTMLRVGLAARTGPAVKGREDMVAKSLVDIIALGEKYTGVQLSQATNARTVLFNQFQQLFERFDVIVSPTLTAPPLPIDMDPSGDIIIDGHNEGTVRGAWYPFTYPQNLTGHPAISIPCGKTSKGLPLGLQICAPWYRDRQLLKIASEAEDVFSG